MNKGCVVALAALLTTAVGVDAAPAAERKVVRKQKVFNIKDPQPVYAKAEPRDWAPAPLPAWGGFYGGLSIGARMADADWTTNSIVPPPVGLTPATAGVHTAGLSRSHLRIGGFAGYNWQSGALVNGVEADFGWADASAAVGGIPGTFAGPASFADRIHIDLRWDASARLRFGFLAMPTWLIYGTGGLAWQNMRFGASCAPAGGYCAVARSEDGSTTRLGWTLGAGMEILLPGNWTARAEYRYADFGSVDRTFFGNTGDAVFASMDVRTHMVLVGVAYKFGGEPAPVSVRY